MKKIVLFLFGLLFVTLLTCGLCLAVPTSATVGTTAITVAPARMIQSAAAWATNTAYVNGNIVDANNKFWMCITNGTSHTSGTGPTGGGDQSDGAINWRNIPKIPRQGISIINDSTNTLYVSVGSTAVANKGIRLNANGGAFLMGPADGNALQSKITVIGAAAGNNVSVEDW